MLDAGTFGFHASRTRSAIRSVNSWICWSMNGSAPSIFDPPDAVAILDLCCFYDPAQLYPTLDLRPIVEPDMNMSVQRQ